MTFSFVLRVLKTLELVMRDNSMISADRGVDSKTVCTIDLCLPSIEPERHS